MDGQTDRKAYRQIYMLIIIVKYTYIKGERARKKEIQVTHMTAGACLLITVQQILIVRADNIWRAISLFTIFTLFSVQEKKIKEQKNVKIFCSNKRQHFNNNNTTQKALPGFKSKTLQVLSKQYKLICPSARLSVMKVRRFPIILLDHLFFAEYKFLLQ